MHRQPLSGERTAGRAIAVSIFILMSVVVPAFILVLSWAPQPPLIPIGFALGIGVFASWRIFRGLLSRHTQHLALFYYSFVYVTFGISPIPQIIQQRFPWRGSYSEADMLFAYGFAILGIMAFELTMRYCNRRSAPIPADVTPLKFPPLVLLMSTVLLFVSAALLLGSGWFRVMFQPRLEAAAEIYSVVGTESSYQLVTRTMQGFALVGTVVLILAAWTERGHSVLFKWVLRAGSCFAIAYTLAVANPISTARAWFATTLIAILGALLVGAAPWLRKYFAPAVAIGYLFVFPLVDIYRSQFDLAAFRQSQMYSATENVKETFFTGDFDSFQQLMNARAAVDAAGYQYGRQMVGTLLFWFPRSIWADKPLNSGDWVSTVVGYSYTNLSCPLWAEGIVDFGWVGTILYLAGYALISHILHTRSLRPWWGMRYAEVGVLILAPYSIYLLRGGLLSCFAYITPAFFAIAILAVVHRMTGTRMQRGNS